MKYLKLKKNTDFQKLFKRGKRVFSPSVTLLYLPSSTLSMGIAVSKKHGKAVRRNAVKRLIRAAFSDVCSLLEQPCTVVVLPKVAEQYSYREFKRSLVICLKKVNACEKK